MITFLIKIVNNNFIVYKNKDNLGHTEDYKEALACVAQTILEKKISDYEVYAIYKGKRELLEEFEPEQILQDYGPVTDDDDEDNELNPHTNFENDDDKLNKKLVNERKGFIFKPSLSSNYYDELGLKLKEALNNAHD